MSGGGPAAAAETAAKQTPAEQTAVEHTAARTGGQLHRLDNRGSPCSLGLIRVKQRLSEIDLGDSLEVKTRDRFAAYEVPVWVERNGLELTSLTRGGLWLFATITFRIRKTVEVRPPRVRAS